VECTHCLCSFNMCCLDHVLRDRVLLVDYSNSLLYTLRSRREMECAGY
jgi:hypothetical protein